MPLKYAASAAAILGLCAALDPAPAAAQTVNCGDFHNRVLAAYRQMIDRAHAHGLRAFGATITPYVGSDYYHPGPLSEADRQTVNQWIRADGHFDAVLDFDAVVRDPQRPDHLLPAYDCGDHLHPSPAGYRAMGESIPLTLFSR